MARMFAVVDTPTARPPRGATLLRSANPIIEPPDATAGGEPDDRWQAGLTYVPEACGSADIVQAAGYCGSGFAGFPPGSDWPLQDALEYVPPYVAVAQECSAIGGEAELARVQDRATRLLDTCQTKGIARELWAGAVAQAETLPNAYLAAGGDDVGDGTAMSVLDGFAALEQGLANCSCGGIGMIHLTAAVATLVTHLRLVERQPDGRLLSALGTIVVADPGYNGTGAGVAVPDEDMTTSWAYATGMVDVRLGPVATLADRSNIKARNDFLVYAFRPFAATFDPCCHLAVKLDHSTLT